MDARLLREDCFTCRTQCLAASDEFELTLGELAGFPGKRLEFYFLIWQWLLETELGDDLYGRIIEYVLHSKSYFDVHIPSQHADRLYYSYLAEMR